MVCPTLQLPRFFIPSRTGCWVCESMHEARALGNETTVYLPCDLAINNCKLYADRRQDQNLNLVISGMTSTFLAPSWTSTVRLETLCRRPWGKPLDWRSERLCWGRRGRFQTWMTSSLLHIFSSIFNVFLTLELCCTVPDACIDINPPQLLVENCAPIMCGS